MTDVEVLYSSAESESDVSKEGEDPDLLAIGIEPFKFEPVLPASTVEVDRPSSPTSKTSDAERTKSTNWCSCSNCDIMNTERECICCMEIDVIKLKTDEAQVHCITFHPGFTGVC
ncbi:uncharacterized protein LOC104266439 [Ciona intestinalis]